MSNYVQSTNFATKDALPSGDPLKIVRGTEINTEFNNIATAVATKADLVSPILVTPALGTPVSGNLENCTFPTLNQSTTGNADTATALQNARTINEVSFNGTANIALPTVNTSGDQTVSGIKTFSVDTFVNGLRVGRGAGNHPSNTAVGLDALAANTTGNFNTAFGGDALRNNTEGFSNTAVGINALLNNIGSNNTSIGRLTLNNNTTGNNNTAVGIRALNNNTTGSNNTAFGGDALFTNTTGSNNISIGFTAGNSSSPRHITTQSNEICIGNNSHTGAFIRIGFTVTSDARDKAALAPIQHGLAFVNALQPTEYQFKAGGRDGEADGHRRYGFLAQDVLAAEGDNPVIVNKDDPDSLKITHDYLIPVLVKAIQELKEEFDAYKATHP